MGFPDYDPGTTERREHLLRARTLLANKRLTEPGFEAWQACLERDGLRALWNFDSDYPGDTVGAVARDREGRFAATASTGGTLFTLRGRVGDSPLVGCGLYAGPHGAVACTGVGEEIVRRFLARAVYEMLARGESATRAAHAAIADVPDSIAMGVLVVSQTDHASACNRQMPVGGARR
jgi:L-asparaginase/beta-aspartyl-peptidase (threonine type)